MPALSASAVGLYLVQRRDGSVQGRDERAYDRFRVAGLHGRVLRMGAPAASYVLSADAVPVTPTSPICSRRGSPAPRAPNEANEAILALLGHKSPRGRWHVCGRIGCQRPGHKTSSGLQAAHSEDPVSRHIYTVTGARSIASRNANAGGCLSLSPGCRLHRARPGRPQKQGNPPTRPSSAAREFLAETGGLWPPHSDGLLSGGGQFGGGELVRGWRR